MFFWSHGPTRWQAGVGLAVKRTFLQHFNHTTDAAWHEIIPGRAARLSLRGASGALDLYVCYLPTGSMNEEQRQHTINKIRDNIAPNDKVLSILMGDWNFVMNNEDRLCLSTMQFTGNSDRPLARNFQTLLDTHQLHELEQLAYTHENTTAQSKLDRIYINHHLADQLDKQFSASTLPRTRLSTHRPITFARRSKQALDQEQKRPQFPSYILSHKQWKRNLHLNYHEKLHNDTNPGNPLRRLELLKQAMWDAATTLQHDAPPEAETLEDKLSWTMIFIRAAETLNIRRMERAAAAYPHISTLIQTGDPNARIHPNFQSLRNHAKDLAHQQLTNELVHLNDNDDNQSSGTHRRQQLITKLARLVPGATNSIGAILTSNDDLATTPTAIATALKEHWEPIFQRAAVNADILNEWLDTTTNFHDSTLPQQPPLPQPNIPTTPTTTSTTPTLQSTSPSASEDDHDDPHTIHDHDAGETNMPRTIHKRPRFPTRQQDWQIQRSDIKKAVRISGNSAPGPDGIPYIAWRHSGDLAVQALQDAATALQSEQGINLLQEMHGNDLRPEGHSFNEGLLICLGKKPHSEHPDHGQVFRPENTRPLSIVNTDNRLIANAARLRWEQLLNPWISPQQQGFLPNRSILKNVLDIDYAAMTTALTTNNGALVLFDFASAFPSISQDYMFNLLAATGVPLNALNMIRALYDNNRCTVQSNGVQVRGFTMTAGVRQGCPLSPLLYAICAELLIERIRMELPTAVVRAYADETAVLVQNIWIDIPKLARIFNDFGNAANLRLNLSKTVVIPLFPQPDLASVKTTITQSVPDWSTAQYSYNARYLGFSLGPDADSKTWKDPIAKYLQRAQAWSDRQLGLYCTATSYNVFALSVLTYIAQVLKPPPEAFQTETAALQKIAPGPKHWISTNDLIWLQHLTGHPRSLASLELTCKAAQTRVRMWDPACADHEPDPGTPLEWCQMGPTRLPPTTTHHRGPNNLSSSSTFQQRANHLRRLISAPDEIYTRAKWKSWLDNSMLLTLETNLKEVQQEIGSVRALLGQPPPTNPQQHWKQIRRKFQHLVYVALHKKHAPDVHIRFAQKLARWKLHLTTHPLHDHMSTMQRTPNWQARCAHQRLKTIATLTTPRVHASVYGAIWNRWCTLRRFQQRGRCRLCRKPHTEDSIEHYGFCDTVRRVATTRLRLNIETQVNIHSFTCTNPLIHTREELTRTALLVYSTYRALNHQRHTDTPLDTEELHNAMCQWVVEGARGHAPSCRVLATTWTEQQGTPLPPLQ